MRVIDLIRREIALARVGCDEWIQDAQGVCPADNSHIREIFFTSVANEQILASKEASEACGNRAFTPEVSG